MKMLKIKADNMRDALAEARRSLGEDAVILSTKQYEEPGVLGLGKKRCVEILASAGPSDAPVHAPIATVHPKEAGQVEVLERQLAEIRRTLAGMTSAPAAPKRREFSPSIERLIRNGVSEAVAETVLAGCSDRTDDILNAIGKRIRCTGGIQCGRNQARVALVGPTGVGKTTTAAKLAARYSIFEKKKVALVTLDTYRIGAVEQLATYARILNIPLEVAFSPEDGEALVARHSDKDLIIIDTVGRSQRNREHITELGLFLNAAKPTEVNLVVSASADAAARREAVDSFGALRADRLILTKLDECAHSGCVLELAANSMMPYSFVTNGQDVPDDIAVAESRSLAKFVWEGVL